MNSIKQIPSTDQTTPSGMDRVIKKKKSPLKMILLYGVLPSMLALLMYFAYESGTVRTMRVERDRLTIATVNKQAFQEYIPVNSTVLPLNTVYLDIIEGGNVAQVFIESGSLVKKGDIILQLTNSNLQLDVMNREAQLYEQINNLRNTRITMEQNKLTLQGQLADINYQLSVLEPQLERTQILFQKGLSSEESLKTLQEQVAYQQKRLTITTASYKTDSLLRVRQFQQLEESESRLWRSLTAVNQINDNLFVKAPIDGQLTFSDANLQIGMSLNRGQRIGQVDEVSGFKLRADIDEFYLSKITQGLKGSTEFDGKAYQLEITKVFPQVSNGRFQVDLEFQNNVIPQGVRRGLTLRVRLQLGDSEMNVLLPRGPFYQTSGGAWVYRLKESGDVAERVTVRLGRQNPDYFVVLEGLNPGDKVITSAYETYGQSEILEIN